MALLTPLGIEAARALGALYGLEVAAVRGIPAGSVNSNYELVLADGSRRFLRVYEEQGREAAAREAALLDHLSARGVETPRPLDRFDGSGFVAEHAQKPVAVFPWACGSTSCQARVSAQMARRVGAALAEVHLAGESFRFAPPSRFDERELARRLARLGVEALPPDVAAATGPLAERLDRLGRRPAATETGVIHGDLFRDNVLWSSSGEISALLDFESASRGSAAFDLMVTVLAWCFAGGDGAFDPALSRAMAQGYAAVRPLGAAERARLFDEASFAALRFTITRITDFELRPKGSGAYKDFRRFAARQRELDRMGPEGLAAMLGL